MVLSSARNSRQGSREHLGLTAKRVGQEGVGEEGRPLFNGCDGLYNQSIEFLYV
jgi:hypothetical protein